MEKRDPQINHLSFPDDVIIFSSGRSKSLELVLKVLAMYEGVSGQMINKNKSHFIQPSHAFKRSVDRVKYITGYEHCRFTTCCCYLSFPFTDLIRST